MSLNWVGSSGVCKRGQKLLKLTRFSPTCRHLRRLVINPAPWCVGWEDIKLYFECILSNCTLRLLILMYYKCEYLIKKTTCNTFKWSQKVYIYWKRHQHVFILIIKTDFYMLFFSIIYWLYDFPWSIKSYNNYQSLFIHMFPVTSVMGKEVNQLKLVNSWVIYLSRFNLAIIIWDSLLSSMFLRNHSS